nr:MAG TPA: hypothetical protein [Caudoviricetes sp.]
MVGGLEHRYYTISAEGKQDFVCNFVCILRRKFAHEKEKCCTQKQRTSTVKKR